MKRAQKDACTKEFKEEAVKIATIFLSRMTPLLLASCRGRDKSGTNKAVFTRTSHVILTHLIALALLFLAGRVNKVNAEVVAQQLPGEILQQIERDRQQQEFLKRNKSKENLP